MTAATQLNTDATLETGVVRSIDPLTVETAAGAYRASRAKSCLVAASLGDTVLVATLATGHAFVLAVLESAEEATTLSFDGEVKLEGERVAVSGRRGVTMESGGPLDMLASAISLKGLVGEVALERLTVVSRYAQAEMDKAKVFARALDGTFERLSQKAKNAYRLVSGSDHVRAQTLDYGAELLMKLSGKNAVVTADDLVKVDGEQIHMG